MPNELRQPPPPNKPNLYSRINHDKTNVSQARKTTIFSNPATEEYNTLKWLVVNNYKELPEKTSIVRVETMKDIGLVYCHMGGEPLRIKANCVAMERMSHANPKPAASVMVEIIVPGDVPHFKDMEGTWFDHYIGIQAEEKNNKIFQKEAMWTIGAKYIFSREGVTKCVFADADAMFNDNSWPYIVSRSLDTHPFVQPFCGAYYLNQPDMSPLRYKDDKIMYSCAFADAEDVSNGKARNAPGLIFACTKAFFYHVLGGSWPLSSLGSGDVTFWLFYKGIPIVRDYSKPYNFRLSDIAGVDDTKTGYSRLFAMHNYHGPMANRLYTTRIYLQNRFCSLPGSDVKYDEKGILQWRSDKASVMMRRGSQLMKARNAELMKEKKSLTVDGLKPIVRKLMDEVYGKLDHLSLATCFWKHTPEEKVKFNAFRKDLHHRCKTPHTLYIFTDQNLENIESWERVLPFRFPTIECANEWNLIHIFSETIPLGETVMYVSPDTILKGDFWVNELEENTIYMARPFMKCNKINRATWDANLLLFQRTAFGIFQAFQSELRSGDVDCIPYNRFIEPAEYISAYAYQEGTRVRDAVEFVDYVYDQQVVSPQIIPSADLILPYR